MRLLVDIGNSRIKWGTWDAGTLSGPQAIECTGTQDPGLLFEQAWCGLQPTSVGFCSVAASGLVATLEDWVSRRWQLEARQLVPEAQRAGLTNGYVDPRGLGVDRWANLLGTRALLGPRDAIVVDAGTAVTVDALRADGRHLGGVILPGLCASRDGLAQAAPALPPAGEVPRLPGRDTAAAMAAGSIVGLAGAIERIGRELAVEFDAPEWLITGGDADTLCTWFECDWREDPLLTLRGINTVLEA